MRIFCDPLRIAYLLTPWRRILLEKLTSSSASQEIPRILSNPKVHYRIDRLVKKNWYIYVYIYIYIYLFIYGPSSPHCWGFDISHSDTPHSVGLLCTRDPPVAETPTWQHTALTRDWHLCPWRNSNPQSQITNSRRPSPYTARPLRSACS